MKNTHLIETDNPSRLQKHGGNLDIYPNKLMPKSQGLCRNQLIYITNEDEIKTDNYWINLDRTTINSGDLYVLANNAPSCKKIILTNDPKLIADGVQELTEEQLKEIVSRYPLDYVEVKREEDGQFIEYSADGSVEKGVYENYSLCFNPFSAEKTLHKIIGEKMYEQRDLEIVISKSNDKLIIEFEILEGISVEKFDEKDWNRFERFVERRKKENDFNNKDNWEFERSSGYAGYRNEITGDWIYEPVYLEIFAEKVKTAEKETLEKIKLVLSASNESQAIRFIEQYGEWVKENCRKEFENK